MKGKTKALTRAKAAPLPVLDKKQLAAQIKGVMSDGRKVHGALSSIHDLSLVPDSAAYQGNTADEISALRNRLETIEAIAADAGKVVKRLDWRETKIKPSVKKHLVGSR